MSERCDIVLTASDQVYINGNLVGWVKNFSTDHDGKGKPVAILELYPTSVMFGDIPREQIDALVMDSHPDDDTVDISKAIDRARARKANGPSSLDLLAQQYPQAGPPAPLPPKRSVSKKPYDEDDESVPMPYDKKR